MKILFIASDNNTTSGAFLSMVKLNEILNQKYNIKTHIILPIKGNGQNILSEKNISYSYIRSYNWVIAISDKSKLSTKIKILIKKFINFFAYLRILKFVSNSNFDIIHINTTYPYIGAKVAIKYKIPFLWHFREYLEEDQDRCFWSDKSKCYKLVAKSNKIVCVSSDLSNKYNKVNLLKNKILTILNGIDENIFYNSEKRIFENRKIVLIYGGGYSYKKGIYEFASMLELLNQTTNYDFEVWFIGNAPIKYKKHLNKLGLYYNVKFLGYQKNVQKFYAQSDIAFTCSACEGFGRKTVEAMLCGTLVIASNTGGSLDIIKDGVTGLLYRQGDPLDLFNKCIYALRNKNEMQKIAENGRNFAYNELTAEKNASKIVDLYKEIIS